jgi:hypothetical protein
MFNMLGATLKKQWSRLSTYSGSRRLSMFSLILLFGLDIYVLGLLFNGMQEVSRIIEYPELAISSGCQNMTENFLKLNAAEKADSLKRFVVVSENYQYDWMSASGFVENEKLLVCGQVRDKLHSYANYAALGSLYLDFDKRSNTIASVHSAIRELKSSYDSSLLEKIAGQKREDSILPAEATAIKSTIAQKTANLTELEKKQTEVRRAIENHPLVRDYITFVEALPIATEFAAARAKYEHLSFWYPVKVFAAEASFLLPLLLLAIVWNLRALKVQSHIQTLISSHLILVSAIPIFGRIVYFVYELLPHRFLANLIASLERLNLGFLWNYVAILGGIGAGLVIIVIAQRTFFSPARQRSARLRKALCRECGEKLCSADQAWCEFCGTNQMGVCAHCGESHRLLAYYCNHCGGALDSKSPS